MSFDVFFRDFGRGYFIGARGSTDSRELERVSAYQAESVLRAWARSEPSYVVRGVIHDLGEDARTVDDLGLIGILAELARRGTLVVRAAREERSWTTTGGAEEAEREEPVLEPVEEPEDHWIQIEVVDDEGLPLANVAYELTLPDERRVSGRTNDQGVAYLASIEAGSCKLRLPELEAEAWRAA
jgi:hypothetical protein